MEENQGNLVEWALNRAEQYLSSAKENIQEERLFVAAEEIFNAIENSLEAMLYTQGIKEISFQGKEKTLTGRMALQFLIEQNLVNKKIISGADYRTYLAYADQLHKAGYSYGTFKESKLKQAISFAEDLFYLAQSMK